MTLLELCMLLRAHSKKVVIIPIVCAAACFMGALALSAIHPSFTASARVVSIGGDLTAVNGLADSLIESAKETSGVSVSSSTTNRTITVTAEGASESEAMETANETAKKISETAKEKQVASDAVVTEAQTAKAANKSPLMYAAVGLLGGAFCVVAYCVLVDTLRSGVHAPESVASEGLCYLGTVDGDESHQRVVAANLSFSGSDKSAPTRTVLLVPTNKNVGIREVYSQLAQAAAGEGVRIGVAHALDTSVSVLRRGREADSVVVVVEAEVSTLNEVAELMHEFKIAGIEPGGFVYLPYGAAKTISGGRSAAPAHRAVVREEA